MNSQFLRIIHNIKDQLTTIEDAVSVLYDLMTDDEQLALLQGEWNLAQNLSDNKGSPYPASTVSRLGLPGFRFVDGSRQPFFTEYPCPLSRAASFNAKLEEAIGDAIGRETQAHGGNVYSGICLNVARSPTWGRAHESYGEDSVMIRVMGTAAARGARNHVMVAVRHFALNSMEILREHASIVCDEGTMNELFLQHFKEVLCESGAEAVLCAGNLVNGIACAENPELLNGILRKRWRLKNTIVVSDCTWALNNGPASIKAGLDLELPFHSKRTTSLERALEYSTLDWSDIRVMAERVLAAQLRYYCRTLDMPTSDRDIIRRKQHTDLARQSVAESMILLKNANKLLPLNASKSLRLSVVGYQADRVSSSHQFDASCHVQGPSGTTPLDALRNTHNVTIDYEEGSSHSKSIESATNSDAVILFVGSSDKSEKKSTSPGRRFRDLLRPRKQPSQLSLRDKQSTNLDARASSLANAILQVAGHKTIVVIEAGSSVVIPTLFRQRAAAILFSSYEGRQYGNGLKDVLFGDQEPSGRLPFVLPDSKQQILKVDHNPEIRYDEWWGYMLLQHNQQKPAYPFGFGLGYADFSLESFWCSAHVARSKFDATVGTMNNGTRAGAAVVQIYALQKTTRRDSLLNHGRARCLIGFAKEVIQPGQSSDVPVVCHLSRLARFDPDEGKMIIAAGTYELSASRFEGDDQAIVTTLKILDDIEC